MNPGASETPQVHPVETQGDSQTQGGPFAREANVPPQDASSHMEGAMAAAQVEDEAALAEQKRVIEALQAQAMQDVHAENPDVSSAMVTPPVLKQPEPAPESILHAPPTKKPFIAEAITQVKDRFMQLFQGVKKLLFPTKGPKPPRPTSFKNLGREGGTPPVSFKQSAPSSA